MIRSLILSESLLCLAACATTCPTVVPGASVEVQKVEVPVEVARVPPADVLGCWAALPTPPAFEDAPGGLLLRADRVNAYKGLLGGLQACDAKWRAWATATPDGAK